MYTYSKKILSARTSQYSYIHTHTHTFIHITRILNFIYKFTRNEFTHIKIYNVLLMH